MDVFSGPFARRVSPKGKKATAEQDRVRGNYAANVIEEFREIRLAHSVVFLAPFSKRVSPNDIIGNPPRPSSKKAASVAYEFRKRVWAK